MTSFVEDLWSSIFTPGPTPTLLVATNATFAALQLLLLALLLATYSVHFVALSVLSAGLWWSINWFASEVRGAQEQAQEEEKSEKKMKEQTAGQGEEESDTETEGVTHRETVTLSATAAGTTAADTGVNATAAASAGAARQGEVRKRASVSGDNSSGYGSTDSEWEKVEEQ